MLGHFGFSCIGLIWLLLIIPNLIWTKYQPQGYSPENENKILLFLERTGEICVSGSALIFSEQQTGSEKSFLIFRTLFYYSRPHSSGRSFKSRIS